jgi:hypothetical protein
MPSGSGLLSSTAGLPINQPVGLGMKEKTRVCWAQKVQPAEFWVPFGKLT